MKITSARDSIFRLGAAKTPGQQSADDFLNSSKYWDLVDKGHHPEHRDTEAELPDYHEDYSVYPGNDHAGPAQDQMAHGEHEDEDYDEPEHPAAPEPEYVDGPQDEYEQSLHDQLHQQGFHMARDGEYRKIDANGNWHTAMMPGDYRRARSMTTEFYNPKTEEARTHTSHNNIDSMLDRVDINHSYSDAQKANPDTDYGAHFRAWMNKNPQSYTSQIHNQYTRRGY